MKFLNSWDLNKNELLNIRLQNLAVNPTVAAGDEGLVWINTASHKVFHGNGTAIPACLTNIIESVTGVGAINVAGVVGLSQAISIAAATGAVPGTMSAADFSKLALAWTSANDTPLAHLAGNETFTGNKTFSGTVTGLTSATVGLGSVDNTSDVAKPVSTAQATADTAAKARGNHTGTQLAATVSDFAAAADLRVVAGIVAKANIASPTFTGTVGGITPTMVGLGSVNNTSDAAKPISTAEASALALKADLVGGFVPSSQIPALSLSTTVVVASQAAMLALTTGQVQPGDLATRSDGAGTFMLTATDPSILGNWTLLNSPTDAVVSVNGQTGTVVLGKSNIGLTSADDTSDANKPVSIAQAAANTADKARANHTGTQFRTTISDFDAGVTANSLSAMAVPTADVAMNAKKITGLANSVNPQDAATKADLTASAGSGLKKYSVDIGNGAATSITVTHNLATLDVTHEMWENTGGAVVMGANPAHATVNTMTFVFSVAPALNALRVVVIG